MSLVAELFSAEDVLLDLDATDKAGVFEEVARLFEQRHGIAPALVVDRLTARERIGSTGLGNGVAVPHARIDGLSQAVVAVVRPRAPIPFDAPDYKPVSDIVVFLVPKQSTDQCLLILAEIAQMFSDQGFLQRLRTSTSATQVHELFAGWQSKRAPADAVTIRK